MESVKKRKLLNIQNVSQRIKVETKQNCKMVTGLKRQELRWRQRTRVSKTGNSKRKKSLCGRAPVKCALCCCTDVILLMYDDRTDATCALSSETFPETQMLSSGLKTVGVKIISKSGKQKHRQLLYNSMFLTNYIRKYLIFFSVSVLLTFYVKDFSLPWIQKYFINKLALF